jgi:uncharacterized protein (DUF1330 family)
MTRYLYKLASNLMIVTAVVWVLPQTGFCQTEKLGTVRYSPPKNWTKTAKENVVAFSLLDKTSGKFCIITLYGATKGTGTPQGDFAREWNELVMKPLGARANPKTETAMDDGWTAIAGGGAVDIEGGKGIALLSVFSGFGQTVSVLGVFNDEAYLPQFSAFVSGIQREKPDIARSPLPPDPAAISVERTTAMHAAALVKEFENNELRAMQQYGGKRVRIYGTVNSVEFDKRGQIVLTFKSSITTYKNAPCYFNRSQSSRVAAINAHQEATVEGTVKGLGDGFDNAKAYLVLEDCIVP